MRTLIYTVLLLFTMNIYSQEQELFYNSWRLFGLNIDGQNYTVPSNEEISHVLLDFGENPDNLITGICNTLDGELTFDITTWSFTFPNGVSTTLILCDNPDNSAFEGLYFSLFEDNINNPFTYDIGHVDFPEWWHLVIYAENGDYAEYEWYSLSNQDNQKTSFTIFPNPVMDQFFVTINNSTENTNLTVYNMLGKIVLTEKNYKSNTSIYVNNLNSGIYFVSIKDAYGNVSVKKLIKK